ncbi:hypothetical protein ACNQO6_18180 [Acinetobacter calcoaceticus]|uniref:hypothetical protein n=1 Tax=Acinetobacter calcoaceticus TaxID=471 RepID=UPI003F7C1DBB
MKQIILLSLVLGITGCTESNTSLDKNLINTTSDMCKKYLTESLKSPSSLKISQINVATNIAKAADIYSVFGNQIISDGVIKENVKKEKHRFRDLTVDIDYEAQNSYGASLRGLYQCKYIFVLSKDETSPKSLNTYLYKIESDGSDSELVAHVPIASFTGSNVFLNSDIKRINGAKDINFTKLDEDNFKSIQDQYNSFKQQNEAERLKKSWNTSLAY